jgi:hypothetical protein
VDWEDGNIDSDPCFIEMGYWDSNGLGVDGDYHLLPGSLCVDAGANDSLPSDEHDIDGDGDATEMIPWDLDGDVRINDGDDDGNVVVDIGAYEFFWPPVEVRMKLTPQALNPESNGNWIKAHFVLPDGFGIGDIDMNSPCKITEPYEPDIESAYVNAFINSEGLVEVEAAFERAALCRTAMSTEPIEVRTEGKFVSGQRFYGTDAIKITDNTLKFLGAMASYWLETNCTGPDWCSGSDLDHSSAVNFADFALIDGCCAEAVSD